ncbi:hypothetical protein [Sorangium sp. So ce124]|uniref:hypothetical protein n=1 Tax=Sorangium sp. So ce124 TaxID=3133280 RepID=UPI003F61174B
MTEFFQTIEEHMKALFLTAAAVLSVLAVGCVEGESLESELAGERVGEAPQAIGDEGCGTLNMSTLDAADGAINTTLSVQTSPDWTYNPPTCPYQYVVEYRNLPAASSLADLQIWAQPKGGWGNIDNEADCERTHVLAGYYVWSTNFSLSPTVSTVEAHGEWSNGGGEIFGAGCFPRYVGAPPYVDGKYKVRVAARNLFCAFSDGCNDTQRTDLKVETTPVWEYIVQ